MDIVRVTQVLDYFAEPWLLNWKLKVGKINAKKISTRAKKTGSRVDAIIKGKAKQSKESIEVSNCLEAYSKWQKEWGLSPIIWPTRITNEHIALTGEPDGFILSRQILFDIKTSGRIELKHWLQVSAYAFLFDSPITQVAILRLDKDLGDYQWVTNDDAGFTISKGIEAFQGLLLAYRFLTKDKEAPTQEEKEDASYNTTNKEVGGRCEVVVPEDRDDRPTGNREI